MVSEPDRPTVSPAKNSLVYFISIAYIDHPVWRSQREEAKRGPPSGHRLTRNEGAMRSWLLPYATPGLSRIAGWCLIGATPRGQPRTPALMLPHGGEGLRVRRTTVLCTFRRPFMGRPVLRQLTRNELLDLTTIVPAPAYHRRSYAERYSRYRRDWSASFPRGCSLARASVRRTGRVCPGRYSLRLDSRHYPGVSHWV